MCDILVMFIAEKTTGLVWKTQYKKRGNFYIISVPTVFSSCQNKNISEQYDDLIFYRKQLHLVYIYLSST